MSGDDARADAAQVLGPGTQRVVLVGMVAYVAVGAFEALAVSTAMPVAAAQLDGLGLYTLAFAATTATSVVGMLTAGRWADRTGPAAPMWAGVGLFLAGLGVAGLAWSMPVLLAGRALQGLGSGLSGVALYVVVARVFPAERRAAVFAWFAAAWVLPGVVGPLLAGLVTEHLGWRWVFLGVPLLALPALLALYPGLVAVRRSARGGTTAGTGGSDALRRVLVPVLRGERGLGTVVRVRACASAAFAGAEVLLPLVLVHEHQVSPAVAGSVLTLHVLGWQAGSWLRGRGLHGLSHQGFVRLGGALLAAGVGGTVMLALPGVPLPVAAAPWVLAGLGMGLTYPTLSLLVLDLAPREVQGTAASALQVSDAVAAAAALAGTGALLWALHDVVGLTAYAVCLGLAAALALLVAALAGRTAVTSAGPGPSRVVEPAGAHPGEDAGGHVGGHVGGTDENHVTPGSTLRRPASAAPS
ncbi:MFS transporter [Isoptericola sp. BMS4]|uniref:MFS transporter n=1 Tax=Isoptericola sp. BMS4 TaxID=2527875 RepID=UPI00196BA269|nr:MFS transporter [Isoptericola sp. BMS4]